MVLLDQIFSNAGFDDATAPQNFTLTLARDKKKEPYLNLQAY